MAEAGEFVGHARAVDGGCEAGGLAVFAGALVVAEQLEGDLVALYEQFLGGRGNDKREVVSVWVFNIPSRYPLQYGQAQLLR